MCLVSVRKYKETYVAQEGVGSNGGRLTEQVTSSHWAIWVVVLLVRAMAYTLSQVGTH